MGPELNATKQKQIKNFFPFSQNMKYPTTNKSTSKIKKFF
jgi:hypothetical protein